MRQTQGAIVCASCGKLVSISEQRCPYCGAWRPGLFGWGPALRRVVGQRLDLVSLITSACVTLFALALLLEPEEILSSNGMLDILSPGTRPLLQLGMTGANQLERGWWWTLLTASYLHGGLLHIGFNMIWLRNLVSESTEIYGPARTFVLFNASGATGFLLSNLIVGANTMGASCSVFGLMAALIVYGRKRGSSAMTAQLLRVAVMMFLLGFLMPGVNNVGHAGGFLGGWVAAHLMGFIDERRESQAVMMTSLGLIVLTVVGMVLSFVKVTGLLLAQ